MSDKDNTHPSFGLVQFNRIQRSGTMKLFGSNLDEHPTTVRLSISEAVTERKYGGSHYFPRDKVVEVEMSATQFAELMTTMNYGSGVPCTIIRRDGKGVEPPPSDMKREDEHVRDDFKKRMEDLGEEVRESLGEYKEILSQSGHIKKADREKVGRGITKFLQEIEKNIPYMMKAFNEAADKVESSAKSEVDAFMTHAITTAGLKHLQEKGLEMTGDTPDLIDAGEEK